MAKEVTQVAARNPSQKSEGIDARRCLALRYMSELMQQMGRSNEFSDPDAWLKSIPEDPSASAPHPAKL